MSTKLKAAIIGASGYTGSELAKILVAHPHFELTALYVSENSADAEKSLHQIDPSLPAKVFNQAHLALTPLSEAQLVKVGESIDAVFLALPHSVSHSWAPQLLEQNVKVFDLSGAYRLSDTQLYPDYYDFTHEFETQLAEAVYGLAEWNSTEIAKSNFIAVPGCYPTASLLALKPLANAGFLHPDHHPVINATSGVSGAGRKASMTNSFCEVSLQAYGVLGHRHQPEIAEHLGHPVVFTPQLGQFKRGILATITVKLASHANTDAINDAYFAAYCKQPLVELSQSWPKLDDVVNSPTCHMHWKYDENTQYLVVSSAIDNLLKGAASQAIQCANICFGLPQATGLLPESYWLEA
ncbi:N-acetyl-gamma-glutamyl-phosphate reductase [Alteromonas sp. a30]|uniref:N-acetyl-gamma-glutamyl-phosphate reductase n=1 Tax=Alteromonas sp. a30 TaxID=2730917 RepID=UPI00227FD2B6|nr:N-acetyl-gamma-glutamyl-phosphate reductase [Alteromonas sp. a30]MCY7295289.1 N-acetyl-gamma-glutamyl-phosphate reductase [Alteromonas sp. a30]